MTHPPKHPIDALRKKLAKMRDEELETMIRRGQLPRIGAIEAVLAALDELPAEAQSAARVVVSDDGETVRVALYTEIGAIAAAPVAPARAIALAGELIAAAAPKLA
jgi:hypothetical protein